MFALPFKLRCILIILLGTLLGLLLYQEYTDFVFYEFSDPNYNKFLKYFIVLLVYILIPSKENTDKEILRRKNLKNKK
jgi:hypothetical protein